VIILFNNNFDTFGKDFIAQIRIADSEETRISNSDSKSAWGEWN